MYEVILNIINVKETVHFFSPYNLTSTLQLQYVANKPSWLHSPSLSSVIIPDIFAGMNMRHMVNGTVKLNIHHTSLFSKQCSFF